MLPVATNQPTNQPTNSNIEIMKNIDRLADYALQAWVINPMKRKDDRFALYGVDGQYYGSYPCEVSARYKEEELSGSEESIGDGFQIVKFR